MVMVDTAEPAAAPLGDEEAAGRNLVKPVANAVRILRYLAQAGRPARATAIARDLQINTSTCFNILRTLANEDVVAFDDVAKTYTTGLGMLKLVDANLSEGQRVALARPPLQEAAAAFNVTMTLWRRAGADRIVLAAVEQSPSDLRIHLTGGQRLPLLMGAAGRLFAAQAGMSKPEVKSAFKALRWARPLAFEQYWREVEEAEIRGWSLDDGYFAPGIMALSAPVRDPGGAMTFATSAVLFRDQMDEAGLIRLGQTLSDLGRRLTTVLY